MSISEEVEKITGGLIRVQSSKKKLEIGEVQIEPFADARIIIRVGNKDVAMKLEKGQALIIRKGVKQK